MAQKPNIEGSADLLLPPEHLSVTPYSSRPATPASFVSTAPTSIAGDLLDPDTEYFLELPDKSLLTGKPSTEESSDIPTSSSCPPSPTPAADPRPHKSLFSLPSSGTESVPRLPDELPSTSDSPAVDGSADIPPSSLGAAFPESVADPNPIQDPIDNPVEDKKDSNSSSVASQTEPPIPPQPYCENPFLVTSSAAAQEWERRKKRGEANEVIDRLMGYEGLEDVKQQFLDIKSKVDISKMQGRSLKRERFNVIFQGNPGTGKTIVARLYAEFLHSVEILNSNNMMETSGISLAAEGVIGAQQEIGQILSRGGGVLFVDEAYQLTASYVDGQGRQVLDLLLKSMEDEIGKLVVIFVGYKDEMESFFEHNPGLTSRIPWTMNFADFSDAELWQILYDNIHVEYRGNMEVESGMNGLPMRIATRRLTQSRGSRGFGNARAVENLLTRISLRQARRLRKERDEGKEINCNIFTQVDVIGPNPSNVLECNPAWIKLQKLIGLNDVKNSVQVMMGMIKRNYKRELKEKKPNQFSLNQLFVGAPGTGKTTVAKLYGQILNDLGLLSRGDLVMKNPADFIGECLGKSEAKTRKILEATVGRVLVIDEAYMLDPGDPNKEQDKFKTGVIDTLVSIIQGVPGEDRCIILVGYENRIRNMFHNANPGLSRRFSIDRPFRFQNFNITDLLQIMRAKMEERDLTCTREAWDVARDVLERASMRPNFTNAGEVNNCLNVAQFNYEGRQSQRPLEYQECDEDLEPQDFDPDWKRLSRGATECRNMLAGRVHGSIIDKFVNYQNRCLGARKYGLNPRDQVPTRFLFKGYPGTGKSTAARFMGNIFFNMGFLSSSEVVECSAGDLIGQYVGHTSPKTRRKLDMACGKVLFIDEAYRLTSGQYAAEAVDEIIQFLTQAENVGKIVIILASYTVDMNRLMSQRPDLSGLFAEEIVFENLNPEDCITLLHRELEGNEIATESDFLQTPGHQGYSDVKKLFGAVQELPGWSNARDVKWLAKQLLSQFLESMAESPQPNRTLSIAQVRGSILQMIIQRRYRCVNLGNDGITRLPIAPPLVEDGSAEKTLEETQAAPAPPSLDPAICTPGADTQCRSDAAVSTRHRVGQKNTRTPSRSMRQKQNSKSDAESSQRETENESRSPAEARATSSRPIQQRAPVVDKEKPKRNSQVQSLPETQPQESNKRQKSPKVEREKGEKRDTIAHPRQRAMKATRTSVARKTNEDDASSRNPRRGLLRNMFSTFKKVKPNGKKQHKEIPVPSGTCHQGFPWEPAEGGGYRCSGPSRHIRPD